MTDELKRLQEYSKECNARKLVEILSRTEEKNSRNFGPLKAYISQSQKVARSVTAHLALIYFDRNEIEKETAEFFLAAAATLSIEEFGDDAKFQEFFSLIRKVVPNIDQLMSRFRSVLHRTKKNYHDKLLKYAREHDHSEFLTLFGDFSKGLMNVNIDALFTFMKQNQKIARSTTAFFAIAYLSSGRATNYGTGSLLALVASIYFGQYGKDAEFREFWTMLVTCVPDLDELMQRYSEDAVFEIKKS